MKRKARLSKAFVNGLAVSHGSALSSATARSSWFNGGCFEMTAGTGRRHGIQPGH